MRAYVVIPEGTRIVRVEASTPHFAASKARGGKGERVDVEAAMVFPRSYASESQGAQEAIPGQMRWLEDGQVV